MRVRDLSVGRYVRVQDARHGIVALVASSLLKGLNTTTVETPDLVFDGLGSPGTS